MTISKGRTRATALMAAAALGPSQDGSFRLVYSVTSTDANGDGQNPVTVAIVQAVLAMR